MKTANPQRNPEIFHRRMSNPPAVVCLVQALCGLLLSSLAVTSLAAQPIPQTEPDSAQSGDNEAAVFQSTVNYVLLDISVTDDEVPVGGLDASNFTIEDDGKPVERIKVEPGSTAISIALVSDFSGSMRTRQTLLSTGVRRLTNRLEETDDARMILFNEFPRLSPRKPFEWAGELLLETPEGQTALYDAVILATRLLQHASYERRVAIVLSDGEDTASETKRNAMLETLEQSGTLVYAIGLFKPGEKYTDAGVLRAMADRSGGLAFFDNDASRLGEFFDDIMTDLRSRYVVLFPASPAQDASGVHDLKITARDDEGHKLKVRSRTRYIDSEN